MPISTSSSRCRSPRPTGIGSHFTAVISPGDQPVLAGRSIAVQHHGDSNAGLGGSDQDRWTPERPELAQVRRQAIVERLIKAGQPIVADRVVIAPSPYPGAMGIEATNNLNNTIVRSQQAATNFPLSPTDPPPREFDDMTFRAYYIHRVMTIRRGLGCRRSVVSRLILAIAALALGMCDDATSDRSAGGDPAAGAQSTAIHRRQTRLALLIRKPSFKKRPLTVNDFRCTLTLARSSKLKETSTPPSLNIKTPSPLSKASGEVPYILLTRPSHTAASPGRWIGRGDLSRPKRTTRKHSRSAPRTQDLERRRL